MEENWKWIGGLLGLIVTITGLRLTWVLSHKKAHKDIYEKMDKKADKDYVETEIKKLTDNLNSRLEAHVHESQAVNELLLNAMDKQGDLIKSMDGKLNILIQKIK